MTRVLSDILGAAEPRFSLALKSMEKAAGNPSHDIHLTTELLQRAKTKLQDLGLDPSDTTAHELYRALDERVGRDEQLVRDTLGIADDASPQEITQTIVQFVRQKIPSDHTSFTLKPSVAKRILKKQPPKRTMKQLGYRSVDSLLKHEQVQHVYVAAYFCESLAWRKKLLEQYLKLRPNDFETRALDISSPATARWESLLIQATKSQRHTVFVVKELGSVVVLPTEKDLPGLAMATLVLALNALNDVMSAGSYLKLQQVKPNFGSVVRSIALGDPLTTAYLEDQPVPWKVVHQFYARRTNDSVPVVFEPHITESDLRWYYPEAILADLHPDLGFWKDTRYTGFFHDASSVSLNVIDAAVNYCNGLSFNQRVYGFWRQYLWQEFMLRYLNAENIERALARELAPQLAFAKVPNEFEE